MMRWKGYKLYATRKAASHTARRARKAASHTTRCARKAASHTARCARKAASHTARYAKKLQVTQQDMQEKLQATQKGMQEQVQTTQESVKATEDKTENLTEKIEELKLALTSYVGFPKVYSVERKGNEVYLPGFYTHHNGYKMCIRVDPNGNGDGEGTHISIFTCLMKGLYDDHLKWPFKGNITIQIVNQAGDHDHIEYTMQYNDETPDNTAGRVTMGERSRGWEFHKFLPHSDLEYNAAKKTQYLKDNHFIVRVVKIELM